MSRFLLNFPIKYQLGKLFMFLTTRGHIIWGYLNDKLFIFKIYLYLEMAELAKRFNQPLQNNENKVTLRKLCGYRLAWLLNSYSLKWHLLYCSILCYSVLHSLKTNEVVGKLHTWP